MKLTLRQVVDCQQALSRLSNEKFSSKISYAIAKNIQALIPELTIWEKTRLRLLEQYGIPNETGDQFTFLPDNVVLFNTEMETLNTEEIDVNIRQFVLPESVEISGRDLLDLDWMVTVQGAE